jgi:GTP pyrophosphokinase
LLEDALAFLNEHAAGLTMHSGEPVADHAIGTARIVDTLNVDPPTHAAALLFPLGELLDEADKVIAARFGDEVAALVADVRKLLRLRVGARIDKEGLKDARAATQRREQVEALRKMLLAFAQDIRVVLIRLASRLQTLRFHVATKTAPAPEIALETLEIYAPLANRLGIWQLKWELEDLAFRFEQPATYKQIARLIDEKRVEREAFIETAIGRLERELAEADIHADVSGRPKHIYSIWRKMRGKELDFSELYDVRAFRVIVDSVKDCYAVLGIVHNIWQPVPREFDDYISRPKPNGYRSLHTVVIADDGQAFEVQIRTHEMHRFAEYGVAAHWRYKEAGAKGYTGTVTAQDKYDERIAWLRQLLAWKDDISDGPPGREADGAVAWDQLKQATLDDHIYVLTPEARVVARRDTRRFCLSPAYRAWPPVSRRARERRDGAAQHAARERPDRRDHLDQTGGPVARLAEPPARLSAKSARASEGASVVQRDRAERTHRDRPCARGKDPPAGGEDLGQSR